MLYLLGPSRSGKGTFVETLLAMLGQPLAEAIGFDVLTAPRDADTQGFRLAPLHSARLIAASESNADNAFKPQSSTKFSLALKRHGYTPTRKRANSNAKLQRGYEDLIII